MLQDISPYELNNHYAPDKKPSDNSPVAVFRGSGRDAERDGFRP